MTAFRSEAVRVLVPASSANVGPGFDSAGLALAVYDELIAMVTDDEGVLVEVAGEGADEVPRDEQHLVVAAMRTAFAAMGQQPTGFVLRCRNAIPHGRGLGSSAAAIIGGMVLARAMVAEESGIAMSDEELLSLATTMESHPDNLSAALHGGFTIAWLDDAGSPGCVRMNAHPDLRAVLAVPTETLPTLDARPARPRHDPTTGSAVGGDVRSAAPACAFRCISGGLRVGGVLACGRGTCRDLWRRPLGHRRHRPRGGFRANARHGCEPEWCCAERCEPLACARPRDQRGGRAGVP